MNTVASDNVIYWAVVPGAASSFFGRQPVFVGRWYSLSINLPMTCQRVVVSFAKTKLDGV